MGMIVSFELMFYGFYAQAFFRHHGQIIFSFFKIIFFQEIKTPEKKIMTQSEYTEDTVPKLDTSGFATHLGVNIRTDLNCYYFH